MLPSDVGVDLPEPRGDRYRALGQEEEAGDREAHKESQLPAGSRGFSGVRLQLLWG